MTVTKDSLIETIHTEVGLNKREAKEFVDSAPKTLKDGVSEAEANEIKTKLEEAGAEVDLA